MRDVVAQLAAMGRLPDEAERDVSAQVALIDEIGLVRPDKDEIRLLLDVLPEDDGECFGLSWSILHIIESSPDWPEWEELDARSGWWIDLLRLRLANAGIRPPDPLGAA